MKNILIICIIFSVGCFRYRAELPPIQVIDFTVPIEPTELTYQSAQLFSLPILVDPVTGWICTPEDCFLHATVSKITMDGNVIFDASVVFYYKIESAEFGFYFSNGDALKKVSKVFSFKVAPGQEDRIHNETILVSLDSNIRLGDNYQEIHPKSITVIMSDDSVLNLCCFGMQDGFYLSADSGLALQIKKEWLKAGK